MATEPGVLDTSTFIWLDRIESPETALPSHPLIAAVTLAELAVGPLITDDPEERALRQQHLLQAGRIDVLPFDQASARAFGPIAAALRAQGSKRRARAFDALIAATAVANGLPLYTGNPDDFADIPSLALRPVPPPTD